MLAFGDEEELPAPCRGAVFILGNFDGVHRGHQAVLFKAREIAISIDCAVGTILFKPHPRLFFYPDEPLFLLTPDDVKLDLLAHFGLDFSVTMRFDANFSKLSAEAFMTRILRDRFAVAHLVVGSDFRFGSGREGTTQLMQSLGSSLDIGVTLVPPVMEGQEFCSSRTVRDCLRAGDIERASRILGYDWFVRVRVIRGERRGHTLGFPTANMLLMPEIGLAHGVYAVRLYRFIQGQRREYEGVANFGMRPTFGSSQPLLEVFLFDFSDNLYDEYVEVAFIGFIRQEIHFSDLESLIHRIGQDCTEARAILSGRGGRTNLMLELASQEV